MIERLLLLVLLALAVVVGWGLLRAWRAARLRRLATVAPLADLTPPGLPAVVAFSLPTCHECRARQAPALARLAALTGDAVAIRTLSVADHPAVARRIGILTVPATAVVDARGTVRHLNLGYADEATLRRQLDTLVAS